MLERLDELLKEGLERLRSAADPKSLEAWRIDYLGAKGRLKAAMAGLKEVAAAQKPAFGQRLNEIKSRLEEEFKSRVSGVGSAGAPQAGATVDLSEPGVIDARVLGRRHILTRVRAELVEVFGRMGFEVAEGPELEDDEHNFVRLNIPDGHPAREPSENYYVDNPERVARPR